MELAELQLKIRAALEPLPLEKRVAALNELRITLRDVSPFRAEPVDLVQWVPADLVVANDYNPNSVAPPEMRLLEHSILEDGYTQPIVAFEREGVYEVVDGFHRNRVGKESILVHSRVKGHLPLVVINQTRADMGDRMASTIRHNRARGKHKIDAMSDIVVELKRRNWTNEKISHELGMEADEVLRLCQITGLAELFLDQEFSKSWDVEDMEEDFTPLQEDDGTPVKTEEGRILHTYEKWECYPAGFYENKKKGMTKEQCEETYRSFLADIPRFERALARVTSEWTNSCEHYLTNERMNRVAWLGQASLCIETGIPSIYCGGFMLLTEAEQAAANETALRALNAWLRARGRPEVGMTEAQGKTEANLY